MAGYPAPKNQPLSTRLVAVDPPTATQGPAGEPRIGGRQVQPQQPKKHRWQKKGVGNYRPSRSSQKLIFVCPKPIVYLPALTPSNFSSSDCSTYCSSWTLSAMSAQGNGRVAACPGAKGRGSRARTHLAGSVELDALDADVLGTGRHGGQAIGSSWVGE